MNNKDRKAIEETARIFDLTPIEKDVLVALCDRIFTAGKVAGVQEVDEALFPKKKEDYD